MELRKITKLAMLLSLAVVLNLIESMIPLLSSIIPGLKLGLSNIVILYTLYVYGLKEAISISFIRVILVGMLRTGLFNIIFFFSLVGGLLSLITMFFSNRYTKLSIIGVSVIGSIFHSIGQIIVAIMFLNLPNVIYYLPYLLILSVPTGIIIGMISKQVLNMSAKITI